MHISSPKLILLLACALFLSTSACKNKETPPQAASPAAVESPPTTEPEPQAESPAPAESPEPAPTGEAFSSGLEKTKQIGDLTDEEKQQLLDATNQHVPPGMTKESLDQSMCTFAAVLSLGPVLNTLNTDALVQEACIQSRDLCIGQIASTGPMTDISIFPATCTATVAETEQCLTAQNEFGADFLKRFPTCDALTVATVTDPGLFAGVEALNSAPPACAVLAEKCPGFLTPLE